MRGILFFIFFVQVCLFAQSEIDTVAYSIDLDDYIVTAQYKPTHYKKALHDINIIDNKIINKIGAVTLDQALSLSPSIRLYQDPILGTSVRMRGVSSSNVAILIDGVPVIGRNNGSIDLSQIALQNIERIEIVEGPLSNIYGNNAAGGVVNMITKKSQLSQWSVLQNNQIESIGQRNHTAAVGYQKNNINLNVHARYFNYDQYTIDSLRLQQEEILDDGTTISNDKYPYNPKTQYSYGTYLRYNINEENYLIAKYDYNREEVADYGLIKRPQFNPYATDQFYQTDRKDLSLKYTGSFKDNYHVELISAFNAYDRIRDDKRYYLESMTFDSLLQSSDSISFNQYFTRASIYYNGWDDWTFGGGYNYAQESGKGDRLLNTSELDSLVTSFTENAIYGEVKYEGFNNMQLSLSSRYLHHSTYDNAMTFSLQSKYDFNDKVTLRSSVAQGYRSPSLKELYLNFIDVNHNIVGNENLLPERSLDLQSTLSYLPTQNWELGLNGYYTRIDDRINLTEYETLKFNYDNIDSYKVFGFQPSLQYKKEGFTFNTSMSLGYFSTNINSDDAPQYGKLFDVNSTLTYDISSMGISTLINYRYIGDQPTYRLIDDDIVINNINGYHLLDMSLSKSFLHRMLQLKSGVRNILNIQSTQVIGQSGGAHSSLGSNNVSIGRSWFLGVQFSLR